MLHVGKDLSRQVIAFQIIPQSFDWVELRRIRWQEVQGDIFGDLQIFSTMPFGTINKQDDMSTWLNFRREPCQEMVHDLSVQAIKQKGEFLTSFRVNSSYNVGAFETILPWPLLPYTLDRPDSIADALLSESGFVLVPDFKATVLLLFLVNKGLGFFFQSSITARSFFGFCGLVVTFRSFILWSKACIPL